eukprot:TRINITY_DN3779_c0_g1_i2.p1 TRINITY_DN3779_c0_g1~~TRINITY_DN3779_c0_g1_i2.p1  ORF type:complete len:140 (-),score=23.01 TRINITY_DN3779_c0_g1_i2:45-464(-)
MADTVQALMEGMVPELEDLRKYKIFNKEEIRQIVKKRRDYEYRLKRRAAKKEDFLMYAQYEMNLEKLRRIRKKRLGIFRKKGPSEFAGVRRIHFIFDRGLRKFKSDMKYVYLGVVLPRSLVPHYDISPRSQSLSLFTAP